MVKKLLSLSLLGLLISCQSTPHVENPEISPDNDTTVANAPHIKPSKWAVRISQFYQADATSEITPYINTIRSFDNIAEENYCVEENMQKIANAIELNPSSLFAYFHQYVCATNSNNHKQAEEYLNNVQGIAEALLQNASGYTTEDAIEIRELDEIYLILELSGIVILDLEIVPNGDDLLYKIHTYDSEANKFEYRYVKNTKLLKSLYTSASGKNLTTGQVSKITFSAYAKQRFPGALILLARNLLAENNEAKVIELLAPIYDQSPVATTLLAEAYLKTDNVDALDNLLDAIDSYSNNHLLDAKLFLAALIQVYVEDSSEIPELEVILQEIDELTSDGQGAFLLAKKLSDEYQSIIPNINQKVVTLIKRSAEQGYSDGQLDLGYFYETAKFGLEKSNTTAYYWYKRAAKQQNAIALSNLGNFYQYGKGVQQNTSKAIEYYDQAANKGFDAAYCSLGDLYKSFSDNVSIEKAITAYQQGAKKGLKNCQFGLGYIYGELANENGKALIWYQKAARQNHEAAMVNLGHMYESGQGVPVDNSAAHNYYAQSAALDSPQGLNNLATFYLHGNVVEKDKAKALDLYKRAAELGNDYALHNLGKIYKKGNIVDKDHTLALSYFEKAAKLGFSASIEYAGIMYHLGQGTEINTEKAIKYLSQTSKQGYKNSSYYLGDIYAKSNTPFRNIPKAIEYLTLSSEQGDIDAPYYLGEIYRKNDFNSQDIEKAIYWHSKAVELNNIDAIVPLATLLMQKASKDNDVKDKAMKLLTQYADVQEQNVNFTIGNFFYFAEYTKPDYQQAKKYYQLGANENNKDATNNLAEIHRFGQGTVVNYPLAISLYQKAAELGSLHALFNLAEMHRDGHGVEKNEQKAVELFKDAANEGFLNAMYQLGLMYEQGKGTDRNFPLAQKWFKKAADKGFEPAQKHISGEK